MQTKYNNVYLEVPYSDREQVKKLGAWWDPQMKKWYIPEKNLNTKGGHTMKLLWGDHKALPKALPKARPKKQQEPKKRLARRIEE